MYCNVFVLVASLIILRLILNQITNKKKETDMEQTKQRNDKIITKVKSGVITTIETVWAIGTSIAGTIVLKF